MLHHALNSLTPDERIDLRENDAAAALTVICQRIMPERRRCFPCNPMIRINRPRHFLEGIAPWLQKHDRDAVRQFSVHVSDADETVSFEFSPSGLTIGSGQLEAHVELTRRELTSVIFGPHADRPVVTPEVLSWLFPFRFPLWTLDQS